MAVGADLAQAAQVPPLFQEVIEKFGRLDILVNNAGLAERKPIADMDYEHLQRGLCPERVRFGSGYTRGGALPAPGRAHCEYRFHCGPAPSAPRRRVRGQQSSRRIFDPELCR